MNDIYRRRAESLFALLEARKDLHRAIEAVPDYTGQYSPEHFYKDELRVYDAAVAEYGAAYAPTADEIRNLLDSQPETR